jgi:hypothetical protein
MSSYAKLFHHVSLKKTTASEGRHGRSVGLETVQHLPKKTQHPLHTKSKWVAQSYPSRYRERPNHRKQNLRLGATGGRREVLRYSEHKGSV